MAAFYDPDETPSDWWFNPDSPKSRQEQANGWRAAQAVRRVQDAKKQWLTEHGYVRPDGHVDSQRFRREHPESGAS